MKTGVCYAGQMIETAVKELNRLANDKNIKIDMDVQGHPLAFLGDAEQFERALVNLVENAIKFTLEGGTVTVRVRQDGDKILFEIHDTGIGIPPELHQQVFERFFRGRQKGVEHVTGSGLGLSIVKTIVENHRGRIWLESVERQGTTFYVSVPLVNTYAKVLS
jgi:two-component system, OmpR family, sensor histidine kinase VicK